MYAQKLIENDLGYRAVATDEAKEEASSKWFIVYIKTIWGYWAWRFT